MNVLELFSGTKSIGKAFEAAGHNVFSVDIDEELEPDMVADINKIDFDDILKAALMKKGIDDFDIIWASPPCTNFSVCNIAGNWKNGVPTSLKAIRAIETVLKTIEIIEALQPKFFFIENPMGMLRTMPFMLKYYRKEVTYCQYGAAYMKPTDIFTNVPGWRPKKCAPGDSCHENIPRGYANKKKRGATNKGVQGLSGAEERGVIPPKLCEEIVRVCTYTKIRDEQRLLI